MILMTADECRNQPIQAANQLAIGMKRIKQLQAENAELTSQLAGATTVNNLKDKEIARLKLEIKQLNNELVNIRLKDPNGKAGP